jgi:hypothetical protein
MARTVIGFAGRFDVKSSTALVCAAANTLARCYILFATEAIEWGKLVMRDIVAVASSTISLPPLTHLANLLYLMLFQSGGEFSSFGNIFMLACELAGAGFHKLVIW